MPAPIELYLRDVARSYAEGNATEHTYRPALKALVESFAKHVTATNEPKRVACGAPDFIVTRNDAPVGFIECKDIGTSLDDIQKTDQLRRYFEGLHNLILTDYLEFRYYIGGQQHMRVPLACVDNKGKVRPLQGADVHLAELFTAFLEAQTKTVLTSKDLAGRMANVAKIIRDAVEKAFTFEEQVGTLHGELESFRATILKDITPAQFADMYAQTVCYGLFSARVNVPDNMAAGFTREHAAYDLPPTNPFLREVFEYIAGTKLDPTIVWAVDLLADILRHSDMAEILKDFGKATRQQDPVVHFYETFLAAYDPALRESRGVYYTPEPIVSYIVRSIDAILKRDFACPAGLADNTKVTAEFSDSAAKGGKVKREVHRVQILDPAAGTGTFLFLAVRHIHEALLSTRGTWAGAQGYVAQHLLPRIFGFELMMAPYAVAHLKLGWLLKETGYDFAANERLRVYLTNTLEESEVVAGPLLALAEHIAQEANAAGRVKTESPIMVVMGNPPYSGHSANKNQWSKDLINKKLPGPNGAPGYFECDGRRLDEIQVKWIHDDYVKFIRFAQYRIERTGYGVLGFITNHGYLDNPTFRGMRQSLMHTFDEIYVLDLHGNAKKKETAPDGSKDENVFDIMQGVAIALLIKRKNGKTKIPATVRHAELFGLRNDKYHWLAEQSISDTNWMTIQPQLPFYLFTPQDTKRLEEYSNGWKITEAMPVNSVGVVTARDALSIHFTTDDLWKALVDFVSLEKEIARQKYSLGEDARDWKVQFAQNDLRTSGPSREKIAPILYRPFDNRFTYYTGISRGLIGQPQKRVMTHMLVGRNLGIATTRSIEIGRGWEHVFCSTQMIQHHTVSIKEVNYLFPLYLYPSTPEGADKLFAEGPGPGQGGRRPNLSPEFVTGFAEKLDLTFVPDGVGDLKKTFGPEDVFHYAYAILHCPTYRTRYAEFLKADFPRLPITSDRDLFARLCKLGAELVGLHLLERVPEPLATFPKPGTNIVDKPRYAPPTSKGPGRIFVNDEQYFDNVPPEVWEFHVGGYQVCAKWLKDRRGRTLSYDEIETYRNITYALRQTIRLMAEIDKAIPAWPIR